MEAEAFVGRTRRGRLARNGSCEALNSVIVASMLGLMQPGVHINVWLFDHSLPLALFGRPVVIRQFLKAMILNQKHRCSW